jgi:signal transduction histidine kinase
VPSRRVLSTLRLRTGLGSAANPEAFGGLLHDVVTALNIVNSVLFVVLALVGVRRWRQRRDQAALWIALAFLCLGVIVTVGRLVPAHPHGFADETMQRLEIELLVLFPYLGYRFATAFVPPARRLQRIVGLLTAGLSIWTFALPSIPGSHERRPTGFILYVVAFLIHWAVLSVVITVRLSRAGRGQPAVARTRMRMLAFAAAVLTVAIIGTALGTDSDSPVTLGVQVLALTSAIAFLLGVDPPQLVRAAWRQPETQRLQEAIRGLMTLATTRHEVAERVLGPVAGLVGASAAAIYDAEGTLLAQQTATGAEGREPVQVVEPGVVLKVWTSPYAPYFGEDELRNLRTVAALTGIALDRVRLFEQEHATRVALERANELMTNFVALAAHELRTPVTTVHGFVQTLNRLGGRLDEAQRDELRNALEQQTVRMAALVEQLLDLSRLDAEAVEIRPQVLVLRERLEEVVAVAAGARAGDVEVAVPGATTVTVDPSIIDHVVTNLVTNALRYGKAPIRVTASVQRGQLRIAVEDSGPGVAREIEETLFERFTRAGVARDRVAGTGLGLAIARAYARAHRGDLRYERGQPTGARFVVELPNG